MNHYDTLVEVADDRPATEGQVLQARGGKKTTQALAAAGCAQ